MNTIPDNTMFHLIELRGGFPGQLRTNGVNDIYLTGNPDSAVPMCNLGDTGMSYYYYHLEGAPHKNMNDLIIKAIDGKMPNNIWEGNILKDVPDRMRPGDDITKPFKVRSL